MSRILKRPMFRKGGSTGQGIMNGLVDRTNMDVGGRAKELEKTYGKVSINIDNGELSEIPQENE